MVSGTTNLRFRTPLGVLGNPHIVSVITDDLVELITNMHYRFFIDLKDPPKDLP